MGGGRGATRGGDWYLCFLTRAFSQGRWQSGWLWCLLLWSCNWSEGHLGILRKEVTWQKWTHEKCSWFICFLGRTSIVGSFRHVGKSQKTNREWVLWRSLPIGWCSCKDLPGRNKSSFYLYRNTLSSFLSICTWESFDYVKYPHGSFISFRCLWTVAQLAIWEDSFRKDEGFLLFAGFGLVVEKARPWTLPVGLLSKATMVLMSWDRMVNHGMGSLNHQTWVAPCTGFLWLL